MQVTPARARSTGSRQPGTPHGTYQHGHLRETGWTRAAQLSPAADSLLVHCGHECEAAGDGWWAAALA
ncbi:hypothetical protein E2C01_064161 [Portunus trituberculatus]|uniref:Uncharacterized protein n=1 Tax=Portunus trituberculatus TaxID=210409 RepID=A0A5B7HMI6_PORTR|nr:hypothetical protein [Portunus trituberculatus]